MIGIDGSEREDISSYRWGRWCRWVWLPWGIGPFGSSRRTRDGTCLRKVPSNPYLLPKLHTHPISKIHLSSPLKLVFLDRKDDVFPPQSHISPLVPTVDYMQVGKINRNKATHHCRSWSEVWTHLFCCTEDFCCYTVCILCWCCTLKYLWGWNRERGLWTIDCPRWGLLLWRVSYCLIFTFLDRCHRDLNFGRIWPAGDKAHLPSSWWSDGL